MTEEKTTDQNKKARMLRGIRDTVGTTSFQSRPVQSDLESKDNLPEPIKPDFKEIERRAVEKDPIAGAEKQAAKPIQMTYYITTKERQEFRIITAIRGEKMAEIARQAVEEYLKKHRHLLPK